MRFRILSIYLTVLLFGCGGENQRYPLYETDPCEYIEFGTKTGLSYHLDDLNDSTTGIYSLEEGDISMIYRAWLSEAAEKSIDIQYFIFSSDNIGLIAADYLLRAADRGIKVRVLVDDIMVEADMDDLLALNEHPNLSIKIYNPVANAGKNMVSKLKNLTVDFRGFNQRMHNKTFIVDNKVVITGGRNIADEYFDYDHDYNFRDRDVLMVGRAVRQVSYSFEQYWSSTLSVPVDSVVNSEDYNLNTDVKYEFLRRYACDSLNFWPEVRTKISQGQDIFRNLISSGEMVFIKNVSFVSDIPGKNEGNEGLGGSGATTDSLYKLVQKAKEEIIIQSPYLITTEKGQELFRSVVERGVKVKILTNSLASTDNLEAFSGYKRDRDKLLDAGVQIFEFRPDAKVRYDVMTGALQKEIGFVPVFGLHAKSMMVDGEVSVIGTFNLDPRSANLNTECVVIIRDSVVTSRLKSYMELDMQPENAWEITTEFNPDSETRWTKRFSLWWRNIVPKSIL